ncbi:TPR-repeat protein, putative [Trypanosoma cruzi marinkellei]|uniref:RNA polymerase II-associated protein 3 n=1 Tax=Trypanosoma cruzi marinkellei TaxID=85056 RepID=K2MLM8_TRYCR|nr:TPR-repeat protein, putative [Trypanosoma cruzi marinkellei]
MDYASAIRQQAEDLQDELQELNLWQEEVLRQEEANRKRRIHPTNTDAIPPVRGTVPSLKEAVLKSNKKISEQDPVKNAKEKGNTFFQAGKIKEAIEAYSTGIELDAEGTVAYVLYGNRALCYLKLERWEDAEIDASACLRLNHSYSKGYFRRAMARKQLGNLRGARTDLEAVLALIPNDASAISEMKTITHMLQFERENAGPVIKRKKVIIAEVDEEEEGENEEKGETNNKQSGSTTNGNSGGNESFEMKRKEHFQKEMQELESARERQRQLQESKVKEEEAKLNQRRRTSARVEVIEEESVEAKNESSTPLAAMEEQRIKSMDLNSVDSKARPLKSTGNGRDLQNIAPRSFRTSCRPSKETLKTPKSFTEFERVFTDIRGNEELCCYYISLIPPASLRTLFGNNMTPDILVGLLSTVKLLPGNVAIAFLQGLCTIKRLEDIALFFDSSEKKVVQEVLDVICSCGASQKDMTLFRERLRVA